MRGAGRITLKHYVPDAGVPDSRQVIRAFARDYDEAIWFAIEVREVLGSVAIDHNYPVQFQVWPLYYVDAMRSVTQQQVAERFCVFGIVEGQLDRFHGKPVILIEVLQSSSQWFAGLRSAPL